MTGTETFVALDLTVGSLASLGLLYLLYTETVVVHYRRFFRLITLGLLLYALTGPIVGSFAPAYIHAVHGLSALCVAVGLADLVYDDLEREFEPAAVLTSDIGVSTTERSNESGEGEIDG